MVKTLVDFVKETPWIIKAYRKEYGHNNRKGHSQKDLIASAEANNITFAPGEKKLVIFGDEQGTLIGRVYDYMLRGRDVSKAGLLYERIKDKRRKGSKEEERKLFEKWIEATQENDSKFEGVDSPSFSVRFDHWLR